MNYSDFNLRTDIDTKTISVLPGQEITILQYLPIEEKNDIIQIALQHAEENGIYNLLKLEMFYKMFIVFSYTNIEFTAEEKEDITRLYDELVSSGVMDAILNTMNARERDYLRTVLDDTMAMKMKYRSTIASVLNSFVENLPVNANAAKDIIEKFNPEDFQRVLNFATAANGNRPIN
jgi:hypothetical protein